MRRRPPRSTQQGTLFPYTTLFRSEEEGLDLLRVWSGAFPASYQENLPAAEAVADLADLIALDEPDAAPLRARLDESGDHLRFAIYGLGAQPSLSDVMPR